MRTWTLGLVSILILISYSINAKDIFTQYPDSELSKTEERHFINQSFVGAIDDQKIVSFIKSGSLSRLGYEVDRKHEPSRIFNNYLEQLKKHKAEIIFSCQLESCGRANRLKRFLKPLQNIGDDLPYLITAKLVQQDQVFYLSIYTFAWAQKSQLNISILYEKPEPLDLVTIDKTMIKQVATERVFESKQHKDVRNSVDHPMFGRLQGAYIDEYKTNNYAKTKLLTARENNQYQLRPVEGKLTYIKYQLPREYSEYEVSSNYQQAFNKLGFTKLFDCHGLACGKNKQLQKNLGLLATIGFDENQFYSSYVLTRPEGDIYAHSYTLGFSGALWSELKIVEAKPLNFDRIAFDADALNKNIQTTGHASLDGLLFKYDSAELLPESVPLLSELAVYLNNNPKLSFYVVGHTDDQGKRAYNQTLSNQRAEKVVDLLVIKHKIAKSQINPVGVGEYAPVANNQDVAGQKQNRRVELVLRSDRK